MKLSRNCCLVLRKCTILLKIFHYIFHHHPYNSACPLHIIVFFLAVGFHIGDLSHCASPAEIGFVIKAWEDNNCMHMCEIQQQFYFFLSTNLDENFLEFLFHFFKVCFIYDKENVSH